MPQATRLDPPPSAANGFDAWILESMSSGIVAVDANGVIVRFNLGAQRILGSPEGGPRSALGRPCREVLASQPAVADLLLEALERETPLSRAELGLAPGASASTIGFTLSPVREPGGGARGAAMIFRDLTPIERRDEQERLRERLAALGQMAAGLAHEIRNPLAGMEVVAGLLRRRLGDRPEEAALVDDLVGELRRLARTVDQGLDFVRPLAPAVTAIEVKGLLDAALATARTRAPADAEVVWRVAAGIPPVAGDEEQLRTVFSNLVINALEAVAATPGARLELSASVRPREAGLPGARELVIGVSDNGPGVPAELREKIFYPFFTTRERGSGVGLALAQKIVASHGGSLELEPGGGPGSHFRVRLPAAEAGS